jgi:hypothetical protein
MDVILSLYENINVLNNTLEAPTTITRPKQRLQDILALIDTSTELYEIAHSQERLDTATLSACFTVEEILDSIRKLNLPIKPTKQEIIDLAVSGKNDLYYIVLKNIIQQQGFSYFEQQELLQHLNNAILGSSEQVASDLEPVQKLSNLAFTAAFDYGGEPVYDISIAKDKFKKSETYNIEYNISPLVHFREATKFGPLRNWTSGLSEDLIARYRTMAPGIISNKTKIRKLEVPKDDTCVSKQFFVHDNGYVRRYALFGKNTRPFQGGNPLLQEYSRIFTEINFPYNLELEPAKEENAYPMGKGSYLGIVEALTKAMKAKLEETCPLSAEDFYAMAQDLTMMQRVIEKIIYTVFSSYVNNSNVDLDVKLCTYEVVEGQCYFISKKLEAAIRQYMDPNAFLEPPSRRIESLLRVYELGLDFILKDPLEVPAKLIWLKRASEQK